MSRFRSLGRGVERVVRSVTDGSEYECRACEAVFETPRESCPECGADAVVATS